MKSFNYVIKDPLGVHARPAGIVVAEAKKYESNITIKAKGKAGDLKRVFALMGLCIKSGDEIEVSCEGKDEEVAADALQKLFESSL